MKLITFTYTKPNGDVSKREAVEVSKPSTLLSAIDVSEMAAGDFAEFANDYKEMLDRHATERNALMEAYDLKHNFRQFKPEAMTNTVVEHA